MTDDTTADTTDDTEDVEAVRTAVAQDDLDELRDRLRQVRLPEAETVLGAEPGRERWRQGVPLADLRETLDHWRDAYDWRPFEASLNRIGQFRTTIGGVGIHFLHRRSPRPDATPLVLTHGWPGSVAEFVGVIDALTEPPDPTVPAFHVVVPSLPGFGFSDRPARTGWGTERIAAAWVTLMRRLGYERFVAHGGDWGGVVTIILGGRFPEHVIGVHTTYAEAPPGMPTAGLTPEDLTWVSETEDVETHGLAYAEVQHSSPQTVGYGLVDSPVALLAWILEKFAEWSDTHDSPFERIPLDRFLDNVTLYWLTATGASAARIYYESHHSLDPALRVDVPAAVTMYPGDRWKTPRTWAEQRFHRIVHWRAADHGGHFPALEVPGDFVADLREGLGAVLAA